MTGRRPRTWQILLAAAAVVLGAGIAWLQRAPVDDPALPDDADTGETATVASGGAHSPRSRVPRRDPGRNTPTAATNAATPEPGPTPAEPARPDAPDSALSDPAPLPAFFENAFGPPARGPDGELIEGTPHELQARLDRERRDDAWADKVEWQLENFLGLQPFTERIGTSNVLCRATVCRVTATAARAAMPEASEGGWQEMMAALRYETVSNEFAASTDLIVFNVDQPHRIGFVTYLERTR